MTKVDPCWSDVGVGVVYNGTLADTLLGTRGLVDAVSLIPETLWHESPGSPRYQWVPPVAARFEELAGSFPCVLHGIGLSVASGLPLDVEHLDQVASAAALFRPYWYSEHLAAFRIGHGSNRRGHAGVGLPVPFDAATLRYLVPKVAAVLSRLDLPVLLENSAIYVEVPGSDMSEARFLDRLCEETGAGVLLDLHNLMTNEANLGWRGEDFLAELDLSRVVEIHVAGGEMLGRWYTDAHSGRCPDRVWELLDAVVPEAPALRLVTYELHESRVGSLGAAGIVGELEHIRTSTSAVVRGVA